MNRDFLDMLSALSAAGAEYLVVGAHAVAVHARPRATGDLDIWVRPTAENAERVWTALEAFGAPAIPPPAVSPIAPLPHVLAPKRIGKRNGALSVN